MKKILCLLMSAVFLLSMVAVTFHAADIEVADDAADVDIAQTSNPYPTQQDTEDNGNGTYGDGYYEIPCTRFAWQQAYDRLGISLPSWGNAVDWWQGAKNAGYATGSTPQPESIAVWEDDYYGHVAYVTSVSGGNTFTVNEGGRTDLDHTDSHGIAYGYTITNAVGYAKPYDTGKTLLGFIYLKGTTPSVTPVDYGDDFYALICTRNSSVVVGQAKNDNALLVSNADNLENCVFHFTKVNNKNGYVIRSTVNDKVLEVDGAYDADGTNAQFYPYHNNPAQIWYFQNRGEWVSMTTDCTSRVLDVYYSNFNPGTNLSMYPWNGTQAQQFNIWKIGDNKKVGINYGDDFYAMIKHAGSQKPIGYNTGNNIELMTESDTNYDRTIWHFTRLNNTNAYRISDLAGNLYIDVDGANDYDGTNVQCYYYHDHPAQEWYIQKRAGYLSLTAGCTTRYIFLRKESTADGTNVVLRYYDNNNAQKFSFDIIDKDDIVNYNISTDKEKVILGNDVNISIGGALPYVYSYKFHILKPNGTEVVIDNKCKKTFSYIPGEEGIFTVFAEVKNPINTDTGSAISKAISFKVGNTSKYILGDANGDGDVDSVDATIIQRVCTMLKVPYSEEQLMCADVDADGSLSTVDATFIQRYSTYITTPYKIGEPIS